MYWFEAILFNISANISAIVSANISANLSANCSANLSANFSWLRKCVPEGSLTYIVQWQCNVAVRSWAFPLQFSNPRWNYWYHHEDERYRLAYIHIYTYTPYYVIHIMQDRKYCPKCQARRPKACDLCMREEGPDAFAVQPSNRLKMTTCNACRFPVCKICKVQHNGPIAVRKNNKNRVGADWYCTKKHCQAQCQAQKK